MSTSRCTTLLIAINRLPVRVGALISCPLHRQLYHYHSWVRSSSHSPSKPTDESFRLTLKQNPSPYVSRPTDVLIKVKAASVNPIDVRMADGYGRNILELYSLADSALRAQLPTKPVEVLGRDFSGVVEAVGQSVKKYKPGDEVYGALKAIDEGTHAEYVLADMNCIALKPRNLTHVEAAAVPYAALTFISAVDPLQCTDLTGKRVFLNGGAGGITSIAIQYLKCSGAEVTVSVSAAARPIVEKLHPDNIVEYQSESFSDDMRRLAGFDLAFDCVGDESAVPYLRPGGRFVTVVSPLLGDTDSHGLVGGTASALCKLSQKGYSVGASLGGNLPSAALFNHQVLYHWGYFMPNGKILEKLKDLIEQNKIIPVLDEVFPFDQLPSAYEKVSKGQGRGKTVIDMN